MLRSFVERQIRPLAASLVQKETCDHTRRLAMMGSVGEGFALILHLLSAAAAAAAAAAARDVSRFSFYADPFLTTIIASALSWSQNRSFFFFHTAGNKDCLCQQGRYSSSFKSSVWVDYYYLMVVDNDDEHPFTGAQRRRTARVSRVTDVSRRHNHHASPAVFIRGLGR